MPPRPCRNLSIILNHIKEKSTQTSSLFPPCEIIEMAPNGLELKSLMFGANHKCCIAVNIRVHRSFFNFPLGRSEITFSHNLLAFLFAFYREKPRFARNWHHKHSSSVVFLRSKTNILMINQITDANLRIRPKQDAHFDWCYNEARSVIMMMIEVLWFAVNFVGAFQIDFSSRKHDQRLWLIRIMEREGRWGAHHRQDGTNANKIKENYNDKIIYASFAFYCSERRIILRIDVLTLASYFSIEIA